MFVSSSRWAGEGGFGGFNGVVDEASVLFDVAEMFGINDIHLLNPSGEGSFIMKLVLIAFQFRVRVHISVEMVAKLLLWDMGGGADEQ